MKVIVFKLVVPVNAHSGCSTMAHTVYRRHYLIGRTVTPVIGTPLFAYASLEGAVRDAGGLNGLRLLKCETDVSVRFYLPKNFSFLHATEPKWGAWWHRTKNEGNSRARYFSLDDAFRDWVLCESLTPVEDVTAQGIALAKTL